MSEFKIERLFIARHGLSLGNVNPSVYHHTEEYEHGIPDEKIPLVQPGWLQALACGKFLDGHIGSEEPVRERRFAMWHSSFLRARQTGKGLFSALEHRISHVYERDELAEVSFGYADGLNDDEVAKDHPHYAKQLKRAKAHRTKHFLPSPNGESRAAAAIRANLFIASMQRKAAEYRITDHIIVTHGATARVLIKQWMGYGYEVTDESKNFDNCDVALIEKNPHGKGYLDYGLIYKQGCRQVTKPIRHTTAFDRMRSDEFLPSFVRGPGG